MAVPVFRISQTMVTTMTTSVEHQKKLKMLMVTTVTIVVAPRVDLARSCGEEQWTNIRSDAAWRIVLLFSLSKLLGFLSQSIQGTLRYTIDPQRHDYIPNKWVIILQYGIERSLVFVILIGVLHKPYFSIFWHKLEHRWFATHAQHESHAQGLWRL